MTNSQSDFLYVKSFNHFIFSFTGLDDSIGPYVQFFINNNVTGQGLLNMTTEDLNKLHVEKIGHQVNIQIFMPF